MKVGDKVTVRMTYHDEWSSSSVSHISHKNKSAYNGCRGKIIHSCRIGGNENLYDVMFPDGQVWCYELEDLRRSKS